MTLQRISTTSYPLVTQQSDLDGVTYGMRFRWLERSAGWQLDITTLDGDPIALSCALVPAWPLLRLIHSPLRPPGELVLVDLAGPADLPTREGFGDRWVLYYVPAADVLSWVQTGELPP